MTTLRGIRLDDDVFEMFKNLSIKEGRNYNKTLAILLSEYFKSRVQNELPVIQTKEEIENV